MKTKVISISAKCSDLCYTEFKDENGNVYYEHDGYVPHFMPGEHYGDYIILDIDVETGKILNWSFPKESDIENFIETEK